MKKQNKRPYTPYFLLFIFSVLLYAQTSSYEFVLDDKMIIENNELVQGGSEQWGKIFSTNYSHGMNGHNDGLYRPLNIFIFNIQHSLWGANTAGFHWVNIILYGILSMLIFKLLILVYGAEKQMLSLLIALLFVAHPIHTEVVANVKSMDEILAMLFGISSFIFMFMWGQQKKIWQFGLSLFLFLLALLSKESILSFVVIIPFALFYFNKQNFKKALFAFFGFVGIAIPWYALRTSVINSMEGKAGEGSFELLNNTLFGAESYIHQLTNALWLQVLYLKQLLIPHPLVFDYSYNTLPLNPIASWQSLVAVALLGGILYLTIKLFNQNKGFVFGVIFYFASLFIVSNILVKIGMTYAERFAFTPSLGFLIALLFLLDEKINYKEVKLTRWFQNNKALVGILALVLVIFSGMSYSASKDWKNNFTLYKADIEHLEQSARANYSYGTELMNKGQQTRNAQFFTQAIQYLEKAISIYPDYQDAQNNLAICHSETKNFKKSLAVLKALNEKHPDYQKAWFGIGMAYFNLNKYPESIQWLKKYAYANPEMESSYYFIALAYGNQADFSNAIEYLNKVLAINANNTDALLMLSKAYGTIQKHDSASQAIERFLKLVPNHPEAESIRIFTLMNLGKEKVALELLHNLENKYPNDPGIQGLRAQLQK